MIQTNLLQKNKQKPKLGNTRHSGYLENIALGLVAYASKNQDFAGQLYDIASRIKPGVRSPIHDNDDQQKLFIPLDCEIALRRAIWLAGELDNERSLEASSARAVLAGWVHDQQLTDPKALVVGIVGLAIPGITLGLIRRRRVMDVLVTKNALSAPSLELSSMAVRASHQVIQNSLSYVSGDFKRISPDLADWFFGEKEMAFYQADKSVLAEAKEIVDSAKSPYGVVEKEGQLAVLALDPMISISGLPLTKRISEQLHIG